MPDPTDRPAPADATSHQTGRQIAQDRISGVILLKRIDHPDDVPKRNSDAVKWLKSDFVEYKAIFKAGDATAGDGTT